MLRSKLQQFMIGRYGTDQLSKTMTWAALFLWFVYLFTGWDLLYILTLTLMVASLIRMFSRDVARRREENNKFLTLVRPLRRRISTLRTRMRDKEHRYFRCPNCKQQMRVPKGKGRIQVTCRNCGISFEEKS